MEWNEMWLCVLVPIAILVCAYLWAKYSGNKK